MCDSDSDDSGNENAVKTKKCKRMCSYRQEWENTFHFLKKVDGNVHKAFCDICRKSFLISHGGLHDIKRHVTAPEHQRGKRTLKGNQTLLKFIKGDLMTSEEEKVVAAELAKTYHRVKHSISYASADCDAKLCPTIFDDSKIATKITLGRTKASSLVYNVLAPASTDDIIAKLRSGVFFSISTDASNHGNVKIFPLLVRFYSPDDGLRTCLLDFYEDPNEKAVDIYNNIKERLGSLGLELKNVSAYSADNASVNFGIHHSVYTLLLKDDENILPFVPAGCSAHMLHNVVKNATEQCEFDVENLVLKVYGYLSYHAQRVQKLKECFADAELQYQNIVRHVKTRWLSLHPAVEKILHGFAALKTYFMSLGNKCPVALKQYFNDENAKKTECFLGFFDNALNIFQNTIMLLEKDTILSCETYNIVKDLRQKIQERISDEFFGFICSNTMARFENNEKESIKLILLTWYKNALIYLEEHFDFSENNHLALTRIFSLQKSFTYHEISTCCEKLALTSRLDMDELYNEFCVVKNAINKMIEERAKLNSDKKTSVYEMWHKLFLANGDLHNLLKIYQFVASIPSSNSAAERVFSLCNNTWTDNRNKLTVEHVKAELQVRINFRYQCLDFYEFVLRNKKLLKCAKSKKKIFL